MINRLIEPTEGQIRLFKYFDQLVKLYYLDSDLFREIIKETIQNKMTSEMLFKYVQKKYNLWKM